MNRILLLGAMSLSAAIGAGATWLATRGAHPPMTHMASTPTDTDKKVLYWYDPMRPDVRFDKPGKSPYMDMPLKPKYAEGNGEAEGVVRIDPRVVQNLALRTARAERGALRDTVRTTGTVAFDERAVILVQARVAGIVEQLDVRAPMTTVDQGQALLTLIAPDWTAAQQEYLSLRSARAQGLDEMRTAARQRLVLIGMTNAQIRAVEQTGQAQTRITVTAPRSGIVADLPIREGASVMAGTPLLRINGLDTVWINAAVPEGQLGRIAPHSTVMAELPAFPGERFSGRIETLLPDIDATTRTQPARIVLPNRDHRLTPGMFARVEITGASSKSDALLIPSEAVIATGLRKVVIVDVGQGRFRAQELRTGDEADGKVQVLEGLSDGEAVVLSGQFLIDSEASLTGTIARLTGSPASPPPPQQSPAAPHAKQQVLRASGAVRSIEGERWTIAADPIASLGMGAMTMRFVVPNQLLSGDIRVGQRVNFAFTRRTDGEFEITDIAPRDERTPLPGGEGGAP